MSPIDIDFDLALSRLEEEWSAAYHASVALRAQYQGLASSAHADAASLDVLRERMERAEALKARVMAQIENLEHVRRSRG